MHKLHDIFYADDFATFGVGRNNLDMANDVLELDSSYTTRTATIGGSLNGIVEYERFELRPELSVSYGKTWICTVGFTPNFDTSERDLRGSRRSMLEISMG